MVSRNGLLIELARARHVLHVGCADHVELTHAKREAGTYLHDLLLGSAASLGVWTQTKPPWQPCNQ